MGTTERTSELVAFRGDNLVTDSDTVARIFEKRPSDVLRAIRKIIEKNERLNAAEDGYKRKSAFIPSDKEERLRKIAESSEHLRNFAESFPEEAERRREFGEGAGKLISEPIRTYEPTAYDLLVAKAEEMDADRKKNEIDSSKRRYFRKVTTIVDLEQGRTRKSYKYEMNRDGFIHLVMTFTGDKAHAFRDRFIQEFNRLESAVLDQLKSDSKKLHLIEDRSRWEDMEWRLQTLEAEKRAMSDRLTLLETKGTVTQLRSDIRRGGFRDAARIFYPPVRVALKRLATAARQTNIETMRRAVFGAQDVLHKAVDKTVDVTNNYDLDLEATYDEETVAKLDEQYSAEFAAKLDANNF